MTQICEIVLSNRGGIKIDVDGYIMTKDKNRDDLYYWCSEKRKSLHCGGFACTILINEKHHLRSTKEHLCGTCYKKDNHPHIMEKQNVDLYDSLCNRSSTHSNQNETQTPNARRLFSIKFNHYFEHSVQCSNCNNRICQNIKRLFHHGRLCKFKNSGKCPIYDKYLESLKMHTECCTSANCSLRFCSNLKSKINHYQLQRAQLL
ncbi:hypothetical protein QTP88_015419 [Uroleucon formosanum]